MKITQYQVRGANREASLTLILFLRQQKVEERLQRDFSLSVNPRPAPDFCSCDHSRRESDGIPSFTNCISSAPILIFQTLSTGLQFRRRSLRLSRGVYSCYSGVIIENGGNSCYWVYRNKLFAMCHAEEALNWNV